MVLPPRGSAPQTTSEETPHHPTREAADPSEASMMRRQSISVFGLGTFEISREHSFGNQGHVARSYCIICPECRLIWADLRFGDDELSWPTAGFCEAHPNRGKRPTCQDGREWDPVPGSILLEEGWGTIDDSLLMALPERLVRREFELHLKSYSQ